MQEFCQRELPQGLRPTESFSYELVTQLTQVSQTMAWHGRAAKENML